MSELTLCNYCKLRRMKEDAKKTGDKITTRVGTGGWTGWVEVACNGKGVAWFKLLGTRCEC
jgi:hypothetical protein